MRALIVSLFFLAACGGRTMPDGAAPVLSCGAVSCDPADPFFCGCQVGWVCITPDGGSENGTVVNRAPCDDGCQVGSFCLNPDGSGGFADDLK